MARSHPSPICRASFAAGAALIVLLGGGDVARAQVAPARGSVAALLQSVPLRARATASHRRRRVTRPPRSRAVRAGRHGRIATALGPSLAVAAPEVARLPSLALEPLAADDLRAPGPGRVPLVIESEGARQAVGVAVGVTSQSVARDFSVEIPHRDLCFTPCTLYVRPDTFALHTGGGAIRPYATDVEVPYSGGLLRMHAGSSSAYAAGLVVSSVGIALTLGGATALALDAATPGNGGSPRTTAVISAVDIGTGLAMMVAGFVAMAYSPVGVASSRPLRASPRWSAGAAPLAGGALAVVTTRF